MSYSVRDTYCSALIFLFFFLTGIILGLATKIIGKIGNRIFSLNPKKNILVIVREKEGRLGNLSQQNGVFEHVHIHAICSDFLYIILN